MTEKTYTISEIRKAINTPTRKKTLTELAEQFDVKLSLKSAQLAAERIENKTKRDFVWAASRQSGKTLIGLLWAVQNFLPSVSPCNKQNILIITHKHNMTENITRTLSAWFESDLACALGVSRPREKCFITTSGNTLEIVSRQYLAGRCADGFKYAKTYQRVYVDAEGGFDNNAQQLSILNYMSLDENSEILYCGTPIPNRGRRGALEYPMNQNDFFRKFETLERSGSNTTDYLKTTIYDSIPANRTAQEHLDIMKKHFCGGGRDAFKEEFLLEFDL